MREIENLIKKLSKEKISRENFEEIIEKSEVLDKDFGFSFLQAYGLPLEESENEIYLKTLLTPYKEQTFCFVDIETNGSSPNKHQIIEIGAIKYKNGEEIAKFESLVHCDFIPEYITKITNIKTEDLKNACSLKSVLVKFKEFLKDSVFVAHNVNFDFNFISNSLDRLGYGKLLNRKLCTIDLAKKTIKAEKYGLAYLINHLNIDTPAHHRALADARSALRVFEESIKYLPPDIKTTEDLLRFARPNEFSSKKRKKKSSSS